MKRKFDCIENSLWLEGLAQFQRGALLAKILRKLEKFDLLAMYRVSKILYKVCQRYQMIERFYTNSVFMFGCGTYGRLGDGDTSYHNVAVTRHIQGIPHVAAMSCGIFQTGLVTVDGEVFMFGDGSYGKLGDGNTSDHDVGVPTKIQGIPKVSALSCGANHTGIVTVDGQVYMFGSGSNGKLGDDNTRNHNVGIPRQIQSIPKVAAVSCGLSHTGIVTVDGDVYMLGYGKEGVLGDGDTSDHNVGVPRQIQGIPKIAAVSCSISHTGIVTIDGDVYMFGNGLYGKLGDGDTNTHAIGIPRHIENIPKVAAISCGDAHTGIVTIDGDVYMFGNGLNGNLGDGDTSEHDVGIPSHIQGIPKVAAISCGALHTGIITVDGNVYMFGYGYNGRLGDGHINPHALVVPTKIQFMPKVAAISCGRMHTGIVTLPESMFYFN